MAKKTNKSEAAKRGRRNKAKGNRLELEIVHSLNEIGFEVASSRSQSKATDDNKIDIFDISGTLPCNIQSKYTSNTPNYFGIRDACTDKSKPFTVIWKKSISGKQSPGTIAMIPVDFYYELLNIYMQWKKQQ